MSREPVLPWQHGHEGRPVRIGIIGDLILDEYLEGEVNRISPEAPIPIQRVTNTFHSAGGAANVARNIALAGGDPLLLGVVGEDEAAKQLKAILAADGIATAGLYALRERPTIRKTRVTASHQQLVRIDWESVGDIPPEAQDWFLDALTGAGLDALILSDYGKGVLTDALTRRILAGAATRGIPTVVDPKGASYDRYRQAFLITPNHKEAVEALGAIDGSRLGHVELGAALRTKYDLANVLVTLGAKGMVHIAAGMGAGEHHYLPAQAREVFDVSGAGDTVVAIIALGLGSGLAIPDAMRFANTAAGIVVEKWGTQPVTAVELIQRLAGDDGRGAARTAPAADRTAVVDFDRFDEDLLVRLEAAAAEQGPLIVKVVRRLRDADWQHRWKQRLLGALACVSEVVADDAVVPQAARVIASGGSARRHPGTDEAGPLDREHLS